MPENEGLHPDGRTVNRWQALKDLLRSGKQPDDLYADFEVKFYQTLRRFWALLKERGVDPKVLFEVAANNRETLHELVRKTNFDSYARRLEDIVACQPGANAGQLLRGWLDAIWDAVRDQLQLDTHQVSAGFHDRVRRMLDRLHSRISRDPSRIPRCPSRKPKSDIDDILGISLV